MYVCICMCVCVCVCVFNTSKPGSKHLKECHHHHSRTAILRSRDYIQTLQCACACGSATLHADAITGACANSYKHSTQPKTKQPNNVRRLVYLGTFGSCSCKQCSLPACCQILVPVRSQISIPISASHKPCLMRYRSFPSRCHSSVPSLPTLQLSRTALCTHYHSVLAAIERRAQRRG